MIHEIVTALAKQVSAQEIAALLHDHPTPTEIWTYRAKELAEQITPGGTPHGRG